MATAQDIMTKKIITIKENTNVRDAIKLILEKRISGLRQMLKIPKNVIPFSLIFLGYTEVNQSKVDRYDSSRIHKNTW